MGNPVTWKNVGAPNYSGELSAYTQQVNSIGDIDFAGIIDDYRADTTKRNTDDATAAIMGAGSAEEANAILGQYSDQSNGFLDKAVLANTVKEGQQYRDKRGIDLATLDLKKAGIDAQNAQIANQTQNIQIAARNQQFKEAQMPYDLAFKSAQINNTRAQTANAAQKNYIDQLNFTSNRELDFAKLENQRLNTEVTRETLRQAQIKSNVIQNLLNKSGGQAEADTQAPVDNEALVNQYAQGFDSQLNKYANPPTLPEGVANPFVTPAVEPTPTIPTATSEEVVDNSTFGSNTQYSAENLQKAVDFDTAGRLLNLTTNKAQTYKNERDAQYLPVIDESVLDLANYQGAERANRIDILTDNINALGLDPKATKEYQDVLTNGVTKLVKTEADTKKLNQINTIDNLTKLSKQEDVTLDQVRDGWASAGEIPTAKLTDFEDKTVRVLVDNAKEQPFNDVLEFLKAPEAFKVFSGNTIAEQKLKIDGLGEQLNAYINTIPGLNTASRAKVVDGLKTKLGFNIIENKYAQATGKAAALSEFQRTGAKDLRSKSNSIINDSIASFTSRNPNNAADPAFDANLTSSNRNKLNTEAEDFIDAVFKRNALFTEQESATFKSVDPSTLLEIANKTFSNTFSPVDPAGFGEADWAHDVDTFADETIVLTNGEPDWTEDETIDGINIYTKALKSAVNQYLSEKKDYVADAVTKIIDSQAKK